MSWASFCSCSNAAGRLTSSDTKRIFLLYLLLINLANLAIDVVLPDPCKPTNINEAGFFPSMFIVAVSLPRIFISSSLTSLIII